jgi:(p)ppGpp synthase/HD superfamily hydrolase
MSLLQKAIEIASIAHDGQVDKSGVPYIHHPLAVMEIVRLLGGDEVQQAAAVLHDVVEDTVETFEGLTYKLNPVWYPGGTEVVEMLRLLTRAEGEVYADYVQRQVGQRTRLIKYADSAHNWVRGGIGGSLRSRYERNFVDLSETEFEQKFRLALRALYVRLEGE